MKDWWKNFFDEIYFEIYREFVEQPERIRKETEAIKSALNLPQGSKILDLACGQGRHAVELAKLGFEVVGLDYSSYLLNIARERAEQNGVDVKFVEGDMRNLPFDDHEFDGVYSFFTSFGYFDDEDNMKVLAEIARVTRPGGMILIEMSNPLKVIKSLYPFSWFEVGRYIVLEESWFDALKMRAYTKRKIFLDGNLIDERTNFVRFYTSAELSFLLKGLGFDVIKVFGDHDLSDYDVESRRIIWVARKRGQG